MPAEIDNIIANLRQLQWDLPALVGDILEENAHRIEDLQTAQLEAGLDGEGNPIAPAYTPFTVQIKRQKGQPSDRVTLKDTGDFHRSMFLSGGRSGDYAIGNSDPKAAKLLKKYGSDVLGLTEASKQEIIDDVLRVELPDRLRQHLGL